MGYITDLHCHPSFKPYNTSKGPRKKPDGTPFTIWDEVPEDPTARKGVAKKLRKILAGIEKDSQCDLEQMVNHGFKSAFCVIHPIERGWFNVSDKAITKIAECLWDFKSEMHVVGYWFTGVPKVIIKAIREQLQKNRPLDYFIEDTINEYKFLSESQNVKGPEGETFTIAENYNHYMKLVAKEDTIAGVLTVEGGHALSSLPGAKNYMTRYDDLSEAKKKKIRDAYLINVKRIKGIGDDQSFDKKHTPIYITLAHFYNNFLTGHAQSYFGITSRIFQQQVAINDGITKLGKEVIKKLLHRDKRTAEKRILIDVKHMSLAARKEYYKIAKAEGVPVIFSHGAVNGYNESAFSGEDKESDHKSGYFSHVSINLYNEDIHAIVDSDGLIGLSSHEGRMPGGRAKKDFDEINKKLKKDPDDENLLKAQRDAYIKLYMGNLFQIVKEINHVKVWDHICIGSDYDGIMDPFNRYPESSDFNRLLGDIQLFLKQPFDLPIYENNMQTELSVQEIKGLMFGLQPNKIMRKIAFENVELFLSKYFTDKYRLGQ